MRCLERAAKAQGHMDWWQTVRSNHELLTETMHQYLVRCNPDVVGGKQNKREGFSIATYLEERRRAAQILTDGVWEMMNIQRFIDWA
eukprot:5474063-Prorocentrum_lima.AAC.1